MADCRSENEAKEYKEAFSIVESLVKPYRERGDQKDVLARRKWWLFKRPTIELYNTIRSLSHCFSAARTTKHLIFSASPANIIFSDAVYVLGTDRWDHFSIVQSTVHEVWARKYSGALKQDLRYSPSKCFETFPFPQGLWQIPNNTLSDLGERYHEHRRHLMLSLWFGLTDIYNLFHSPDLEADLRKHFASRAKKDPQGLEIPEQHRQAALAFTLVDAIVHIESLRHQHKELDNAVRDAFGWSNLPLEHGFYEVETLPENDRIRFTISPAARKEILSRLLKENQRRAADEKDAASVSTEKIKTTRKKKNQDDNNSLSLGI